MNKSRSYKRSTVRKLDTLSGNQCYASDCNNQLIAKDETTIISDIAHIEAASVGGPRFNPDMNDDERRHFNNLILLCPACHKIIDNKENEAEYPVALLHEWKKNHESRWQQERLTKASSLLRLAINKIAEMNFEEDVTLPKSKIPVFSIDEKIRHNAIKRNKVLIEEYRIYQSKVETLYTEIEKQGSFKKDKLLRNIKTIYLKIKGRHVKDVTDPIQSIRNNADAIFEDVEEQLFKEIAKDSGDQDVAFEISIIMIDAFMRCKIMEEVPQT